jgi:hypothetical protein
MNKNEWYKIVTRKRIRTSEDTLKLRLKYQQPYKNPNVKVFKVSSVTCQ